MDKKIFLFPLFVILFGFAGMSVFAMEREGEEAQPQVAQAQQPAQGTQEQINQLVLEQRRLRRENKELQQNQNQGGLAFIGNGGNMDQFYNRFKNKQMESFYNAVDGFAKKTNSDGVIEVDKKTGKDEYKPMAITVPLQTTGAVGATLVGGVLSAIETKAKAESETLIGWIITSVRSKYWVGWNRLWHGSIARELTTTDINRWRSSLINMYSGLIRVADKAQTGGKIGHGVKHLFAGADFGLDDAEGTEKEEEVVDKSWLENKKLYLTRIKQIVSQIQFRKQYNKKDQEIVLCMDQLISALVGDFYDGGLYARIDEAKTVADLAEPQISQGLQLFKEHIEGLLDELREWVNVKSNTSNGSSSSSSRYNSSSNGYGYGSNGF